MNARNKRIVEKFKNGETETALALYYKITRERIRTILVGIMGREAVSRQAKLNVKAKYIKLAKNNKGTKYICKNCGKPIYDKYLKRIFCDPECFREYQEKNKLSEEEKIELRRAKAKAYYLRRKKI